MSTNTKIEWCDHTFNPWISVHSEDIFFDHVSKHGIPVCYCTFIQAVCHIDITADAFDGFTFVAEVRK